ncbi:RidA family protein [Bryobacter aggregatus]|uniref:RidA family protein n=1 Tax=Bryobacter aggregatus TaxID=360054 RepID=UPI0004E0F971|nr:RidA family protein [Bryobacter aggregatus]
MIEHIFPATMPVPKNPYSLATKAGGFVFVSGQASVDPASAEFSFGDIAHETRLTLQNVQRILEGSGATLAQVVKVNVYLANENDFAAMNAVYVEFFGSDRPARTTIGCRFANPTMKVEIDCIAYVGE